MNPSESPRANDASERTVQKHPEVQYVVTRLLDGIVPIAPIHKRDTGYVTEVRRGFETDIDAPETPLFEAARVFLYWAFGDWEHAGKNFAVAPDGTFYFYDFEQAAENFWVLDTLSAVRPADDVSPLSADTKRILGEMCGRFLARLGEKADVERLFAEVGKAPEMLFTRMTRDGAAAGEPFDRWFDVLKKRVEHIRELAMRP